MHVMPKPMHTDELERLFILHGLAGSEESGWLID